MPVYRLTDRLNFPPPELAEDGLLAVGGDLRRERLLLAYRMGIFPWYNAGDPILWWSPDPRMVLSPATFRVPRRFARLLRGAPFEVAMDTAFEDVVDACATVPRPDQDGTWITSEMREAYCDLHAAGYAHSIECRQGGALVGGVYGVCIGGCFFGESMFSRVSNASRAALTAAMAQFQRWGIGLVDCQVANAHLVRLGARALPRRVFLAQLRRAMDKPTRKGQWRFEFHDLAEAAAELTK